MRTQQFTHLGKRDLVFLLEITNRSLSIRTEQEFRELMLSLEHILPLEGVVTGLSKLSPGKMPGEETRIINISYPPEWLNLYLENRYLAIDPIVRNHVGQFKPQIWSQTFKTLTSLKEKKFFAQAKAFNLDEGLTVGQPCRHTSIASLFSFQGRQIVSHPRHVAILKYLTPFLHDSLMVLSSAPAPSQITH
ncbi:MAG TPA: hypothetical protein DEP05_07855 [Betaproteobacteria bacterium]|nr:hypothetical protein [Betaproteobacteria bacterium]